MPVEPASRVGDASGGPSHCCWARPLLIGVPHCRPSEPLKKEASRRQRRRLLPPQQQRPDGGLGERRRRRRRKGRAPKQSPLPEVLAGDVKITNRVLRDFRVSPRAAGSSKRRVRVWAFEGRRWMHVLSPGGGRTLAAACEHQLRRVSPTAGALPAPITAGEVPPLQTTGQTMCSPTQLGLLRDHHRYGH